MKKYVPIILVVALAISLVAASALAAVEEGLLTITSPPSSSDSPSSGTTYELTVKDPPVAGDYAVKITKDSVPVATLKISVKEGDSADTVYNDLLVSLQSAMGKDAGYDVTGDKGSKKITIEQNIGSFSVDVTKFPDPSEITLGLTLKAFHISDYKAATGEKLEELFGADEANTFAQRILGRTSSDVKWADLVYTKLSESDKATLESKFPLVFATGTVANNTGKTVYRCLSYESDETEDPVNLPTTPEAQADVTSEISGYFATKGVSKCIVTLNVYAQNIPDSDYLLKSMDKEIGFTPIPIIIDINIPDSPDTNGGDDDTNGGADGDVDGTDGDADGMVDDGADGADGADGTDGADGMVDDGADGADGTDGMVDDGADGADGTDNDADVPATGDIGAAILPALLPFVTLAFVAKKRK